MEGQLGLCIDRTAIDLHVGIILGRREESFVLTVVHRGGSGRPARGSLIDTAAGELVGDAARDQILDVRQPRLVDDPAAVHAQAQAAVALLRELVEHQVGIAGIGGVGPVAAQLGVDRELLADIPRPACLEIEAVVGRRGRADVAVGVGIIGVEVQHAGFLAQRETFAERDLLELRVRFQAHFPGRHARLGLDHHGAGSQVAIDHRGDAADDFDTLDVIGRNLPRIDATAGRGGHVALAAAHRRGRGEHLQIGIVRNGGTIHDQCRAGRIGGIGAHVADGQRAHLGKGGILGDAAGQQLHHVLQARGLDVLDGLFADLGGGGDFAAFAGRHHHGVEREARHGQFHAEAAHVALDGDGQLPGFVAQQRELERVRSGRNTGEFETAVGIADRPQAQFLDNHGYHHNGFAAPLLHHRARDFVAGGRLSRQKRKAACQEDGKQHYETDPCEVSAAHFSCSSHNARRRRCGSCSRRRCTCRCSCSASDPHTGRS